ncbi:sulfotransferase [Pseudoxanthomonas sangjuensis]|nr:sulfotransferase [Pseudoxanthomonas sangjuensis]
MNGRSNSLEQIRQRYAQAVDALNRRQWAQARTAAESLLTQQPQHAGVHFIIGVSALEQKDLKAAFRHLLMANELNPDRADYAAQWSRVLLECHQQKQSVEQADRAMQLDAKDPMTLNTLGVIYTRCNEHVRAVSAFRRAVELVPEQANLHFNLATSLMANGEIGEAAAECERCIQLNPMFWRAHLTLSQLQKQKPESNHVDRLRELVERARGNPEATLYLNLALEKEYDDLGRYEDAFRHLKTAKDAWKPMLNRSVLPDDEMFDALVELTPALTREAPGFHTTRPIFIIGMPRSGTTLIERIVSSHPDVHSAGELQNFPVEFKRVSGVRSGNMLDRATLDSVALMDWEKLGRAYIESTERVAGGKPRFTDKLPQNFLYAGFIAKALPDAKIVCLRRDPMDTCVANYRQLFALTSGYYNYSYDLLDTGRYYLGFDRFMKKLQDVMPGRILEISYEDLVQDQETVTRGLIAHCGLEWNDDCLNFERNEAPVSTASAVQVRSPIYRTSLQRWKRYGNMVDGLRELLREGGVPIAD